MNDTERALCDLIERACIVDAGTGEVRYGQYNEEGRFLPPTVLPNIPKLEHQLAEARLQYAACSNEYRRVIADLTACRTNALAATQERDALKATLEQAREALNNFSQAFFEFTTAAVRDTEEPFIPQHLADLYGMLVRRAQAAEQVLGALDAGREAVDLQATRCLEP